MALHRMDRAALPADPALDEALREVGSDARERGLCAELIFGVLRHRNTIDWLVESLANRPVEKLQSWARNVLRLGVYQIAYLDKVPPWAAVDESVNLAEKYGHRGTASLVNAVLREMCRRGPPARRVPADLPEHRRLALELSHPEWIVKRWIERLGPEGAASLMRANNEIAPLSIRLNVTKPAREEAVLEFVQLGGKVLPGRYCQESVSVFQAPRVTETSSFERGLFTVQDEASVIAGLVVDPAPGEIVIDACSAPGGKATHLLELSRDEARVYAVDRDPLRLAEVAKAAKRLGLKSLQTLHADARTLFERFADGADRVLVDAPCSSLGAIRRNPDVKWRRRPEDIPSLARLQEEILDGAAPCVKPGGILVYCTCSTEPEENLEVVERFLEAHHEFELEDIRPFLPEALRDDATARDGYIQLWPHVHGTDGFFTARLRRGGGVDRRPRALEFATVEGRS